MLTQNSQIKKLLSYDEAAALLCLHPASIRRLVSKGKLDYIKIGRSVRFTKEMLIDSNYHKSKKVG